MVKIAGNLFLITTPTINVLRNIQIDSGSPCLSFISTKECDYLTEKMSLPKEIRITI